MPKDYQFIGSSQTIGSPNAKMLKKKLQDQDLTEKPNHTGVQVTLQLKKLNNIVNL